MNAKDVQTALAQAGFRPGPLDGIWGRQTIAAVRQFQLSKGLEPDGIAGPLTLAALFPDAKPRDSGLDDPTLVWFHEARRLIGTREDPSTGNNPKILDWATNAGITYGSDDIPWCGLFVAHCISSTLDREPTPASALSARAWGRFGIPTEPTPGAVMVFWRKSVQSKLGHVGFYAGEDATAYRILGGNQSDQVSLAWVAKSRFLAARWPSTVPPVTPTPVKVKRTDSLSWNEG